MPNEYEQWMNSRLDACGVVSYEEWRDHLNIREDWGDSVDDMDGSDWGDLMSGPDDDEQSFEYSEGMFSDAWDMECMDVDDPTVSVTGQSDTTNGLQDTLEGMPGNSMRHSAIIKWLENPEVSLRHPLRAGFFIDCNYMVRLQDGTIENILDWLDSEGIEDGAELENYVVELKDDDQGFRLCFYRILDAPFQPLYEDKSDPPIDDFDDFDDVPF